MTPDEIQSVFGSTVPDYEVVPVAHGHHRKSRQHRIMRLTSFEREMTLYLEPTDGYLAGLETPVFRARYTANHPSGVEYERVHDAIKPEHNMYQDPVNLAALMIKDESDGKASIHGVIDELAIRPLPARLRGQFKRERREALDEFSKSNRTVYHPNLEDTHHHVVFKLPKMEAAQKGIREMVMKQLRKPRLHSTRNVLPDIVHPQVLIVVETNLFRIFKQDVNSMVDYLLSYWNAIDLRYRVFRVPAVRINIAAIVLAEDHWVTPYIAQSHIQVAGQMDEKIEVTFALRKKSQFFYPETKYNPTDKSMTFSRLGVQFDMIITMSAFDMCQFDQSCLKNGKHVCNLTVLQIKDQCITLGYAYYTGACAYNRDESLVESVGIVEDQGGFDGIIPTAHEVGHLMGASHSPKNDNRCPVMDGYIMSYSLVEVTGKSFMWSNCSAKSIKRFFKNEERAQCLFNKPDTGALVERVLPGKIFSRDEQCDRTIGTHSCRGTMCNQLYCTDPESKKCLKAFHIAVAEGSTCGVGKHCINAKCVSEKEDKVHLEFGLVTPVPVRKIRTNGR